MMFDVVPSTVEGQTEQRASYLNRGVFQLFWAMYQHKTQWRWQVLLFLSCKFLERELPLNCSLLNVVSVVQTDRAF